MSGVNGTNYLYGMNNPYAMNSMMNPYASSMNDDFMAQSAFGPSYTQQYQQAANYPTAFQGYQQAQTDEFQKQGGGSALTPALVTGTIAGGATTAGIYNFATSPIKDGKVDQNLLNILGKQNVEETAVKKFEELYQAKAQKVYDIIGVADTKQYNAVNDLAKVAKLEYLPENTRKLLPASIQTPAEAKAAIDLAKPELEKIDTKKLSKSAAIFANNEHSVEFNQRKIDKLNQILEKVKTLKKDATVADIEKFFVDNAETFKLKGTDAEIKAKASKLAAQIGTQEKLLNRYQHGIDAGKARIAKINLNLEDQFKSHWDESAKAFKKDTPEALTKAYKNFKWNKAGKFGAIAAGAGLLLGYLFGKNA